MLFRSVTATIFLTGTTTLGAVSTVNNGTRFVNSLSDPNATTGEKWANGLDTVLSAAGTVASGYMLGKTYQAAVPSTNTGAGTGSTAGGGSGNGMRTPEQAGISSGDAARLQNAANRTGQEINVVGSRANGTATPMSDWDYFMSGNSAQRHSAASSVPSGVAGSGSGFGIDIFTNNPNSPFYQPLDSTLPYVPFSPQ